MCCPDSAELCDGTALGGASCESLGYGAGVLTCGDCVPNPRDCRLCTCDDRVTACGRLPVDAVAPLSLSLAVADDGTAALAWVTGTEPDAHVHFARVDANLAVLEETSCFGPASATSVAVAPSPSGWLVAVGARSGSVVIPLAKDGAARGLARDVGGSGDPMFAQRPGAPPLLVLTTWEDHAAVARGMLLADAGSPTTNEILFSSVTEPQYGSATFTGDAFLVAERTDDGVQTARVGLDGRVTARHHVGGAQTEYPQVAWTGTGGRITWADFGSAPTLDWQTLDANGAPTGDVVLISGAPSDYAVAPIVTSGEDTVVFLPGVTGWTGHGGRVAIERLDAAGDVSVAPFRVDAQPSGFFDYRVAVLGDDVLLAWIEPGAFGGIVVARVHVE